MFRRLTLSRGRDAIAVLFDATSVTREHMVDTRHATDREIDFHICAAATNPLEPTAGWDEGVNRRTDGNLREVFG